MNRLPDQPDFKGPLPPAMQANRSTANNADEDLVLTVLAAVSRHLEGTDNPINSYLHKYRYGEESQNTEERQ